MTKQEQIEVTLKAFQDMGATAQDLQKERVILEADERYLEEWYTTVSGATNASLRQESQAELAS